MRTLIIPCAGNRTVDGVPLFLNYHPDGTILAKKSINGVFASNYDRIIFTILKEIEEEYHASEIITENINNAEIVILEEKTQGPAETVYKTLEIADVEGEFAVRDSHAYVELAEDCTGNFVAGLDLTVYEKSIENLREKSFIVLNEQKQILDVIEKHFCSDVISAGFYGFKNTSDYKMAYKHLSDPNYPITKLYVSHIISYLIGYKQRVFHAARISNFEDWSSASAWQKIQKRNATCFVDLDKCGGVIVPYNTVLLKTMIDLSRAGIKFVAFTSSTDDFTSVQDYLLSQGVNIISVIGGCSVSKSRMLILSEDELSELVLEV